MAIRCVHHMLEQRKVELVELTRAPHHVLMTSLSDHNSYELHVFVGIDQKWGGLEAPQQKYKNIRNILFVALKCCSVFAHFHFAHFVRLFIYLFLHIIHKEDHAGSIISHTRKNRFELGEEKRKRNRSTAKHVLVKEKIYRFVFKFLYQYKKNTHFKT